jgi:hypothetical protein
MAKKDSIEQYINTIVGATVTTKALCTATGCSLPTVLSFIKENASRFEKVKRGTYTVRAISVTVDTNNSNNTTFEW